MAPLEKVARELGKGPPPYSQRDLRQIEDAIGSLRRASENPPASGPQTPPKPKKKPGREGGK